MDELVDYFAVRIEVREPDTGQFSQSSFAYWPEARPIPPPGSRMHLSQGAISGLMEVTSAHEFLDQSRVASPHLSENSAVPYSRRYVVIRVTPCRTPGQAEPEPKPAVVLAWPKRGEDPGEASEPAA